MLAQNLQSYGITHLSDSLPGSVNMFSLRVSTKTKFDMQSALGNGNDVTGNLRNWAGRQTEMRRKKKKKKKKLKKY